jgi:hypothetical protein
MVSFRRYPLTYGLVLQTSAKYRIIVVAVMDAVAIRTMLVPLGYDIVCMQKVSANNFYRCILAK